MHETAFVEDYSWKTQPLGKASFFCVFLSVMLQDTILLESELSGVEKCWSDKIK